MPEPTEPTEAQWREIAVLPPDEQEEAIRWLRDPEAEIGKAFEALAAHLNDTQAELKQQSDTEEVG